jgi:hypothetical protein
MEKEFLPYAEALELKQLGFDKPCFEAYFKYHPNKIERLKPKPSIYGDDYMFKNSDHLFTDNSTSGDGDGAKCTAPLYQQAFRWFEEKYKLYQYITQYYGKRFYFTIEDMAYPRRSDEYPIELLRCLNINSSKEEAELECLRKLIQIIKNK